MGYDKTNKMEKINVAELLKDCPQGMELDCTSYDNLSFDKISEDKKANYPICCYITDEKGNRISISFTEYGCESERYGAKCVIFPKGKTTWEGFHRPFKDGDMCYIKTEQFEHIFIFKDDEDYNYIFKYANLSRNTLYIDKIAVCATDNVKEIRLATEEEKQKLFDAIKDNGYKWNSETKTLENLPKFKVGDRIKEGKTIATVVRVCKDVYDIRFDSGGIGAFSINLQDRWELVPNKFDITTLKPFESKVLVRDDENLVWRPAIFGLYKPQIDKDYPFIVVGGVFYTYCIPYEGNQHLLGTTNDCDEFYKI